MGYELIHHRVTQGITEFNQFEIKRIELRDTLCYSVVKTHYFFSNELTSPLHLFSGLIISISYLHGLIPMLSQSTIQNIRKPPP